MNNVTSEPLGSGIFYRRKVPLSAIRISEEDLESQLAELNYQNEQILKTLLLWNEKIVDPGEEQSGTDSVLMQLDFKVNVMMELLGYYLAQNSKLPREKQIMLNSSSVHWIQEEEVEFKENDYLLVQLYLKSEYPKPVSFPTQCALIEKQDNLCQITSNFYGFSESVVDQLDKLIFREHRRNIALRKPAQ
jgi:hypothetical protein